MEDLSGIAGEPVDFSALLQRLRHGWRTIVLCSVGAVVAAAVYLHLAIYRYTAEMRVAPVQGSASDGLSSKLGSLGGLAAAAGVAIPETAGGSTFKLYLEALQSRDVSDRLVLDHTIMEEAFASEWDPQRHQWHPPHSLLRDIVRPIATILGVPEYTWQPPNAARLQVFLQNDLRIDQNAKTPVVTITTVNKNPLFATRLLVALNATVDQLLRQRTLLRTNEYIAYLEMKLATVQMQEQRNSIAASLGDQERIKMAASSTRPFAAEVFDTPSVSDRPTTPGPYKVLAVALSLGLAGGLGLTLLRRDPPTTVSRSESQPAA